MTKLNKNTSEEIENIKIQGAREHNLKDVNVIIPRDKLTVITGLSGSGKSSLAFDTLYAEGQRRYVQTMSPYAKQFLGVMKKPEVDRIEGLSPAISIEQKTLSKNPRSTVGTVTEIYDYLRLLFSKIGIQYSIEADVPVIKKSDDQIIDEILSEFSNQKIQVLAPVVRGRKGHYRELFDSFIKEGYVKVRIDGQIKQLLSGMQTARYQTHDIELLIDRFTVEESYLHRIKESITLAIQKGEGTVLILSEGSNKKWTEKYFNTNYSCPVSGRAYQELSPNKFSFNSPYGSCKTCEGLGELKDFDIDLVIPDDNKSILDGAIEQLDQKRGNWIFLQLESFAKKSNIDLTKPFKDLNIEQKASILHGSEESEIELDYKFGNRDSLTYKQKFRGIIPTYKYLLDNASTSAQKRKYENLQRSYQCTECNGGRLNKESLFVRIADHNIAKVVEYDINDCLDFFKGLTKKLNTRQRIIGELIIKEIITRLEFLNNVGLNYLTLGRSSKTLSGGEAQRIRLASQIGSKLVGIMYVLDEPSIGLHQHDNYRLINSLKNLRDIGNTLIVVEHDKAMIEEADYVIDMGPGAGVHGGELVFSAIPSEINSLDIDLSKSLTYSYLNNDLKIDYSSDRREGNNKFIKLKGATGNNLQNVDMKLPLGKLVLITGMSGSGKSSLIKSTLYPILASYFYRSQVKPLPYKSIEGIDNIDKIIEIDQQPIGRTPRSNPATYSGMFTLIRDFFAQLPESKIRGYKTGRFSFNVKDGRCAECEGAGIKKIEMNFLPDVFVKCTTCNGKRYNNETLEVKYKHKSISDVLDLTVEEALDFFSEIPKIKQKVQTLFDVGLTYITLGQQAPTLSGGEAQRVKLATELSKRSTGKTLYLLDEPTTGLHFHDINLLMGLLNKLVDKGNSVLIIEHNLDVIKCADWIIDLGPEGGKNGGYIVAEGTPENVIKKRKSLTAKYLKEELKNE
ncbi:excinuclease ABC subunit UvrA [Candidatus Kapabacteria bacterium]|nr:excinuclease ABC subunit UvrA [Candidatus Kapabacteria bacterium]